MAHAKTRTIVDLCEFLSGAGHEPLTKMAISQFVSEGMPQAARGRYDLEACTFWYLGKLRTNAKRKLSEGPDGKTVSLDDAQRRLTLAKAESEELDLAERKSELVPLHLHESMLTHLVQITKQRILNIPSRLGSKLEGCTSIEIKALLTASLKDALAEIARKEASRVPNKRATRVPKTAKPARSSNARKSKSRK